MVENFIAEAFSLLAIGLLVIACVSIPEFSLLAFGISRQMIS
jgi:hypothetical protein